MRLLVTLAVLAVASAALAEDCTDSAPCTLPPVLLARARIALEKEEAAKMADADLNEHNVKVAERFMDRLRERITKEKELFSRWCEATEKFSAKLREIGQQATSVDVYKYTGKPDTEEKMTRGSLEGKTWSWIATGPFSQVVSFLVTFARPIGSSEPWAFLGCSWCASGSQVTHTGCVELPWKP